MGGLSETEDANGMSKRTHFWLRVAALAVIAAAAWLPRASQAGSQSESAAAGKMPPAMAQAHASVASR